MDSGSATWAILAVAVLAANLPFFTERLLFVGPARARKPLGWRLLELLLMAGVTVGIGLAIEARIGQVHRQGWEFYAAWLCLFLTLAFPGFIWRYLKRRHP